MLFLKSPLFDQEIFFAILASLVSVIRYGTYLWSIYKRETRPHVFSYLNWGLLVGIGAFAQYQLHGGPSVYVLMLVSATCLFIAFVALFVGEKNITRSDWLAFIGALIGIVLWQTTNNPTLAILCVVIIDILTYYPTFRKSWNDPWGEPPMSYFWAGFRYFLALFAVPNATLMTLAYPFYLMITDWGFAAYVVWRRKILSKQP